MSKHCPGSDGLSCIDGWLYSAVSGMIFPANKKCPHCNPPELMDHGEEDEQESK